MGRLLFGLVIIVVIALVVTMGFQIHTLLTAEPVVGSETDAEPLPGGMLREVAGPVGEASGEGAAADQVADGALADPDAAKSVAKVAIGRVVVASGDVSAVGKGQEARSLRVNSTVFLNDRIVCNAGSKAKVALDDGTVLWLGESSELVLDEYTYEPNEKSKNRSVMRFVKGMCRMVTGAITTLNPEGFKVKMRVATVGIRGCETGFEAGESGCSVHVMGLGDSESVIVNTTTDGSAMMDPHTGQEFQIESARRKTFAVDNPGFSVKVTVGKGAEMGRMSTAAIQKFMSKTTHLPPAKFDLLQNRDGSVVVVSPQAAVARGQESSR